MLGATGRLSGTQLDDRARGRRGRDGSRAFTGVTVNPIATIATAERRQARGRYVTPATAPSHEGDVVANTRSSETHVGIGPQAVGLGPTARRIGDEAPGREGKRSCRGRLDRS